MVIYRPQRGGLSEALAETKEFNSFEEMKKNIVNDWEKYYADLGHNQPPFSVDDIVIDEETINDERCGWHDTRYVCVKRMGDKIYDCPQCIGMCATDYEK